MADRRFLSKAEVLERVGVTYPTIWQWMRDGTFPRSRQLGAQKVGWFEDEIEAWMAALPVRKLKGEGGAPKPKPKGTRKVKREAA